MATTNDAMYAKLRELYPNEGATLGDLLYRYWSDSGATTIATTRTNLVANPNFEVSVANWNGLGPVVRITSDSYLGAACAQYTKLAGRNEIWQQNGFETVGIVGGRTYTASAYLKVPAGQESMNAGCRVIWYDANNVQIAPTFLEGTYGTLTNTDGWQRRSFTGIAPANAVSIRTYFGQKDSGTAGQTFLLDAVMVEEASTALPYFDGTYVNDYQGYGLSTKAWNGAVNNSSSTASWFVGNTRTNLITNPNFEVNLSGYSALGTITRSTAESYLGVASAALVHDTVTAPQLISDSMPVVAGLDYTMSFYVKQSVANGGTMFADFRWLNAAGTMILDDVNYEFQPNATWQRFSQTRTAPAGAVRVQIAPRMPVVQGGPIPTINYMDGIMVEQASSALPYFDGTFVEPYAGYGLSSKTWNGTANASSSTAIWFTGNSRKNLIANPNAETNVVGWTGATARTTEHKYIGSASILITSNNSDYNGTFYVPNPTVQAGLSYTFSAYAKIVSGNPRGIFIVIQWKDSAGNTISQTNSANNVISSADGWIRRVATGVAPAGAVQVALGMTSGLTGLVAGWLTAYDAVVFEQASSALPYFDGTYADPYAGYTITQQGWAGTANASTSSANWFKGVGSGLANRGALQYDYYISKGAVGTTLGDLANSFWSESDTLVSNLMDELGNDLLLEDGSFMLLEAGNL
jgi:hypothetical protein